MNPTLTANKTGGLSLSPTFGPKQETATPTFLNSGGATPQLTDHGLPQAPDFSSVSGSMSVGNVGTPGGYDTVPKVAPTSSGGISFDPGFSKGFGTGSTTNNTKTLQKAQKQTLSDFITKSTPTSGGGNITTSGNGDVVGSTPAQQFSIDTSGSHDSSHLTTDTSAGDVNQKQSQYADYIQGLAKAQGYSPEYIQSLQQQQQAQAQGAALQLNSAALNSNLYTGNNLPGDTLNYAQGATAKAQAQNTLQESQNSLQQLSASQQMQVQALIRSGNIAAAQSLVDAYKPQPVSYTTPLTSLVTGQTINGQQSGLSGLAGINDVNTYTSFAHDYPGVNIPPWNPNLTPAQNRQIAGDIVSKSPQYQAQFQGTYQTPGGGLSTYSKLNPGGNGSQIVSGVDAASGSSDASSLHTQQDYLDTTTRAYNTANTNLANLQGFMKQYGINESNIPIVNQLQNKIKAGLLDPGALAAYKSDVTGLRTEYSQVLSRGGARSVETDNAASSLIPDDLNPSQLSKVFNQLNAEGHNAIKESQNQINTIKARLGGTPVSSASGTNWPGWNPQ